MCPYGTATERARKRINSAVNKFVNNDGHCVIHHPNIRAREKNLYRFHGTHLSDIGVNIYLNNIQGAVETFMSSNQTRSFLPTKLSIDVYFSERFSSDSVRVVGEGGVLMSVYRSGKIKRVTILSCIVPRIILCFYFPALPQEVVFRPYHVYHEWPVLNWYVPV